MTNDWILEVLADLKAFAQSNGMPDLTEALERARDVAVREIGKGTLVSERVIRDALKAAEEAAAKGR